MKLKDASRYFDTCSIYDGYTNEYLFKVQASTFMESSSEGSVSVRRVLSLAPNFTLPERSVVKVLGELYVSGHGNLEEWNSSAIRKAYWTRKVTDTLTVNTPNGLLTGSPGLSVYAQKKLKGQVNSLDSSNLENVWEFYFSASEEISKSEIFTSGNIRYRADTVYKDIDGFLTVEATELQYNIISVVLDSGKIYDPVSDTYIGTSSTVQALPMDYKLVFDVQVQAAFSVQPGDTCLLLPFGTSVSTGMSLAITGGRLQGEWRVLNITETLDSVNVHARRL